MQTKTQLQLILENETLRELNAISYDANARLSKENEALLAKNKELEEELQERKAYIVANPCAQCGGKINAMKCEAWAKKAKELEEKCNGLQHKVLWQECRMLKLLGMSEVSEVERSLEEVKLSIWKDVSELPEVDHDCVICTNRGKMAFAMYQHTDKSFTYQVDETDGSVSNGSIKPHEMYKYTTLTDFINQVENMEARLRKLEGK